MRDETLKEIFNHFVDKKVIVTTVFDCCYSGNLMMSTGPFAYWEPDTEAPPKKALDIDDIVYSPNVVKPIGCRVDSLGNIIDTLDTDKEGKKLEAVVAQITALVKATMRYKTNGWLNTYLKK